jgi:alpha-mannosidase
MNVLKYITVFLFLPIALSAQTSVDKCVRALDSLGNQSYSHWKVSPDLRKPVAGDPTKAGFDDSRWDNLELNQRIYPDSCWIRKEIALPANFLGQEVKGPVKFLVSVDDYGYMFINGEAKGYFPWDGEFELTKDARPGQKFLIAIKAINTGGPLRLLRAELELEASKTVSQMLRDFALSLRVGQKLTGFDTYQTNATRKVDPGIDKSRMDKAEKNRLNALLQNAAASVDVGALAQGDMQKFTASVDKVRAEYKPVAEFAKRYTLFFDANAHIDAAWLWRERETVEVCKNTFSSVLRMMDARPDFTYAQSSAAYYDWMERLYPDIFKKIQSRVKDKRWEITGGMWVEPDCNLPSGESWMRHLLYAKKYFKEKFGVDVVIGWNPDSFGYNWNMPAFYLSAGIDAFVTQKIGWNERNVFPYRLFWWESADGSKILSYFPFDYGSSVDDPYGLVDWMRQFDANTGFTQMMILFGVGDHGGGPSDEMIDRIEHLKNVDIYPKIAYGTTGEYLDLLKAQDLSKIPTWNSELYLEFHQGTFTTQAKMKEWNRKSEVLLTNAEKFSTLSTLFGGTYNGADLREAWRNVLFNQFHDILPGSGIREVYIDGPVRYEAAKEVGTFELKKSLEKLTSQINTKGVKNGKPLVIFNPLAWERSDVVTVKLPEGDDAEYAIVDGTGRELPSQAVRTGKYSRDLSFLAENVPATGYKMYALRRQKSTSTATALQVSPTTLENQYFKITLNPSQGWIQSITDKRKGKEILSGSGNELQMLEDRPAQWDAWNVGLTGVKYPITFRTIEILERGPVRATLRVVYDYLKPGVKKDIPTPEYPNSFFTQDIMLYNGLDRIDFRTGVDWWEDKTMLKVAFPVTVTDTAATYEIPYGTIQRSTQWRDSWDSAKVEVPAQRWADLSGADYGVSLLNKSKYGYDIKGSVMRLSLLRSPQWPDRTADRGKHQIEYALYPHTGSWRQAGTVRRGYEYNCPLLAFEGESHAGKLPQEQSFITLGPPNLVLTTVKKAEDSGAWIIQWYESAGEDANAVLTLPRVPAKVLGSNFLEEDKDPVPFEKNVVKVATKKHSFVTLKVTF